MKRTKVVIFNFFVNEKYNSEKQIMEWYESMKENYLVDCNRLFVIYTDNLEIQKKLCDEPIQFVYVDENTTLDVRENRKKKFRHIKDFLRKFNPEFDYFSFIQSTARCVQKVLLSELSADNDLIIFKHCGFNGRNFHELYGNNAGSVVDLDEKKCNGLTYFYAAHFLAKKKTLLDMCEFVNSSQDKDDENDVRTAWDDETYLNYYFNVAFRKNVLFPISIGVKSGSQYCHSFCNKMEGEAKIEIIDNFMFSRKKMVVFGCFVNRFCNSTQNIRAWYKSLKEKYMVGHDRRFVIFTDNLTATQEIKEPDIEFSVVDWKTTLDIAQNRRMKWKWILQYLDSNGDFDFFCHVADNARCREEIFSDEIIKNSDLVICKHCTCNNEIPGEESKFCNKSLIESDARNYIYYDESHFIGRPQVVREICHCMNQQIDYDMENGYVVGKDVLDEEYWNNCINGKFAKDTPWRVGVVDGKKYACNKDIDEGNAKIELVPNNVKRKNVVIFSYFVNEKYNSADKIREWYQSLKWGYLTDCNRLFVIYTDNPEFWNTDRATPLLESNILVVKVDPSTTRDLNTNLKSKFKYIQDYLVRYCQPDMDYFCCIQSNARCVQPVFLDDLIDNGDQLFCCEHAMMGYHLGEILYDFNALYGNNDKTCVALDRSKTYNFKYIHACHFLATRELLERFCIFINDSISIDDKNGVSTRWHDETYFNYYMNTVVLPSNERVKIKPERIFAASGQLAKLGIDVKVKFLDKKHAWWGTEITGEQVIRDRDKYDVPRVIWQFWFGDSFPSYGRIEGLLSMVNINVDNIIVLEKDVEKYQVPGHPFHPAWKYLSNTHKSDYMRCYFMHFYGGGYADIKSYSRNNNWKECLDLINSNKNIYVLGEADKPEGMAFPEWRHSEEYAKKCVCCSYFIMRKQTSFTEHWFNELNSKLDENIDKLKACYGETKDNPQIKNENNPNYPFRWSEILGEIIHKIEYETFDEGHISRNLRTGRIYNQLNYR